MPESDLTSRASQPGRPVSERVERVVRRIAPRPADPMLSDLRLIEDLGYHSLALLELAFALEEEFSLSPIDAATARRIHTVGDIEAYLTEQRVADL